VYAIRPLQIFLIAYKRFYLEGVNSLFGYIRPFKAELKIREFEEYKSYYCTLCKTLDKEYGFLAKFFLNYDFTFLALLLISLEDEKISLKTAKCTFNPLKKCKFCLNGEKTFQFVADISILFLHYKLIDNILDDHFIKKIFASMINSSVSGLYKKAVKRQPYIDSIVKIAMDKQNEVEKTDRITVKMAAHPSANLLGEVCAYQSNDDNQKRILYELGYHLGKWVYLIDALDDYKKDLKGKTFNPFIKSDECGNDYEEIKKFAKDLIEDCITGYENAFLLLDIKQNHYILENILFEGNPSTYYKISMKERKCYE
jgi:hypothetical protein